MKNIYNLLSDNSYPGRGIMIGTTESGRYSVVAYFIMGRSENSRNRIFVETEDGIRTECYDESKLTDPSLILYNCVRRMENKLIVTNGDQTDTIYDYLIRGRSFQEALQTRDYEPDAPNYTPRISGLLDKDGSYQLSIIKNLNNSSLREFFEYEKKKGIGHFISTYKSDGNPIPSFVGNPIEIVLGDDSIENFSLKLWDSLDKNNKVSLFVSYIELNTGENQNYIINKNKR